MCLSRLVVLRRRCELEHNLLNQLHDEQLGFAWVGSSYAEHNTLSNSSDDNSTQDPPLILLCLPHNQAEQYARAEDHDATYVRQVDCL